MFVRRLTTRLHPTAESFSVKCLSLLAVGEAERYTVAKKLGE
jgi:hypothetical protein